MNEIANRHDNRPAPVGKKKPNPLRALPAVWRRQVAFLYSCYSDVLKAPVGIVSLLCMWIKNHGLTLEIADGIFRRLLTPEEVGKVQHGGQLLARLAQLVAGELEARRRRERLAEDQQRFDRAAHHAAPVAAISDIVGGALGRWRTEDAPPTRPAE